ncbi:MAG: DNA mismatch repair protein MutS [Chloroflexi bacterium]|nr:DNA mismatch repair protein MutS [Chloroflexota bacterium]MCY3937008.1 DNA mismatch repair protein MutS [Chloroflexota bacterium]
MTKLTPMRRQYLDIKRLHPDAILFFRLGDFYEMFDDDALVASEALRIVITSREMGRGVKVPMCGVPHHAAENYIARLLKAGHKVAVCDQIGQPGAGLVERRVTRVITPGTVVDDGMLTPDRNNYLAAVAPHDGGYGLAYADVTTGEFVALDFEGDSCVDRVNRELARISSVELLIDEDSEISPPDGVHVTTESGPPLDPEAAHGSIERIVGPSAHAASIGVRAALAAARLLAYLESGQQSALHVFTSIHSPATGDHVELDEFTRRNLEIDATSLEGVKQGSLLGVLDRTRTPMGSRMLRRRLISPLRDLTRIETRLDQIQWLTERARTRTSLREDLRRVGDIERTCIRIRRASVRADELLRLADSLRRIETIAGLVSESEEDVHSPFGVLDTCAELRQLLERALDADQDFTVRSGFNSELDRIRSASAKAREGIAGLQNRLRLETGIKSLKVGYNRVFGYYLEVGRAASLNVPDHFEIRQTLANSQRYSIPELKEFEAAALDADERGEEMEQALFAGLVKEIQTYTDRLSATADRVARLDVAAALADLAIERRYVRPQFTDDGELYITQGRHPVVEAIQTERFVPNDCHMGAGEPHIVVLTGPNMAGKSTFLRQVALIALMAQSGCYVPADSARLPIVDRIFTRVGSRDDIASGQSTFLVEMNELSAILSRATPDSLIVLDEIGRGTSTYDGVSIAKSVVEFLHNHPRIRSKTIFATHYHELTSLAQRLPRVVNYNVAVAEQHGKIVFLHAIVPGAADRSYGIHVARLAGLPDVVTRRAEEILSQLESQNGLAAPAQMSLLPPDRHPILDQIEELDLEGLSPLDALNKLYEWRSELDES